MIQELLDELQPLTDEELVELATMLERYRIRRTPYGYLLCYTNEQTWCTIAKDPATLRRAMGF